MDMTKLEALQHEFEHAAYSAEIQFNAVPPSDPDRHQLLVTRQNYKRWAQTIKEALEIDQLTGS